MSKRPPPLWRCPKCGARLVTRHQWHSCGRFSLVELFSRSEPGVRRLFRQFTAFVRRCGPVTVIPQKSRVVFLRRVRFISVYPRRDHFVAGIVLTERRRHPRLIRVERFGRAHVHSLRLGSAEEFDAGLLALIRESRRRYGEQGDLRRRARAP